MILEEVYKVIKQRIESANPESSYVAKLHKDGVDKILKKVAEENCEFVIAVKDNDEKQIVYEMADLWFHSMIALAEKNIDIKQLFNEFERRFGTSGITEKQQRGNK